SRWRQRPRSRRSRQRKPMPADSRPVAAVDAHRCGTAAVVWRRKVARSTLLNALIGQRLSITGPKPQTTRHRILGVVTREAGQILVLDTPGLHKSAERAIGRQLNHTARQTLGEADVVVHVVEAGRWKDEDERRLGGLRDTPA